MHFGQITVAAADGEVDVEAEEIERRRRIAVAIGATVLIGAAAIGGAALRGHVLYGDWKCGFRTCMVPPNWRRRR